MNRYLVLGVFALLIVVVSLIRLLSEQEFFRLTSMKKVWGRRRGLAIHFLSNVGLPMVVGVVFLTQGVVDFDPQAVNGSMYMLRQRLDFSIFQCEQSASKVVDQWAAELSICP